MEQKLPPYVGTSMSPEKTQVEIQRLLYKYGAKGTQWTEVGMRTELRFIMDVEGRPVTVRIEPPMIMVRKRERGYSGSVVDMPDKAASYRALYWWLKAKLEAVSYGLVSVEEEFLAHIAGRLPTGEEVTVGQIIIPKLSGLDMTDLARALPAPKKTGVT